MDNEELISADTELTVDTPAIDADTQDTTVDSTSEAVEEDYYESLIESDLESLKAEFPELLALNDITEIKNPLRYAALRDLGLTPTEAYLAARGKETKRDNRAHLSGTVPGAMAAPHGTMPRGELERARELFYGMSDSEIQALYRKVTK